MSKSIIASIILCMAVFHTGCTQFNLNRDIPWVAEANEEDIIPERVVAFWTDSVMHKKGQPGQRGFGGRIFFYSADGTPMKVKGGLAVYAFDADTADAAPERKFVFPAENLASHYSKNQIGHSYSFFLPFGKLDGPTRHLKLVTRFDGENGGTIISEPATKLLPGTKPASQPVVADAKSEIDRFVKQASFTANVEPVEPTMPADTIQVTPSFAQRLQQIIEAEKSIESESKKTEVIASGNLNGTDESSDVAKPKKLQLTPTDIQPQQQEPALQAANAEVKQASYETILDDRSRFGPSRFPLRRGPRVQPGLDPLRRQPHRGGAPSALPPTPRSGFRSGFRSRVVAEGSLSTTVYEPK